MTTNDTSTPPTPIPPAEVERLQRVEQAARDALTDLERRYVRAVNAILACAEPGSPDWHRWQGHAEAYRQSCEALRHDLGLPSVAYRNQGWREANGVYTEATIASWCR